MVGSRSILVTSWALGLSLWVRLWMLFFDCVIIACVIRFIGVGGGMWEDGEKWGGRSWVGLGDVCEVYRFGVDCEIGGLGGVGFGCDNEGGCGFNTKLGGF